MASTLDTAVSQIKSNLQLTTSAAVHQSVNSILKGRPIDASVIGQVTGTVINRTLGGVLNTVTQNVNSTISKALGKKFKNSPLNAIAGNVVASVMTSVITGRQAPGITVQLTNAITQGISTELLSRLPKSITKNVGVNILGTTFMTSITPYVARAVNDTVGAVVKNVLGAPTSIAALPSVPGINKIPSVTPGFSLSSITSLPGGLGPLTGTINSIVDQFGASTNAILQSITNIGRPLGEGKLTLPAGLDLGKFNAPSGGLSKMIEMSSTPIGGVSKVPGMSAVDFRGLQSTLSSANASNPMATQGGAFEGFKEAMAGLSTGNGVRGITKDMSSRLFDINSAAGVLGPQEKQALDEVMATSKQFGTIAGKTAITDASTFQTLNPSQLEKLTTVKEGFRDPQARYPLPEYVNRTETNKLATGDVDNTIVDKKNAERMMGAQLPNGASWDQPACPYNAKYPYNHVRETESGHIIELDDTPGSERIHVLHKSGTFQEVDAQGNRVQVIRGSDYTIIDANGYISVQGKANVSVTGECNVFIGANANIEVQGNAQVNCHNNMELNAAGRLKLTAGEGIDIKSPEVYIDADNTFQLNADVNARLHTKEFNLIVDTDMKVDVHNDYRLTAKNNHDTKVYGVTKLHSIGDIHWRTDASAYHTTISNYDVHVSGITRLTSVGDVHVKTDASMFQTAASEHSVKSGANSFITAGGNIHNRAGGEILEQGSAWVMTTGSGVMYSKGGNISVNSPGSVAIDGATMHINSGQSVGSGPTPAAAPTAAQSTPSQLAKDAEALETEYCDAHYLVGRKSHAETIIPDKKVVANHASTKIMNVVSENIIRGDSTLSDKQKAELIEDHDIHPTEIKKAAIILETLKPAAKPTVSVITPAELPLGDIVPPANLNLSPNFTLGDLTLNTLHPHVLEPVGSAMPLSKVVANLQYIAMNVLEPVYAARTDMQVHTGFIPIDKTKNEFNQHSFGLAVSLTFTRATSIDDYTHIADLIQQMIHFDELVLSVASAKFVGGTNDSGMIIVRVPGAFYPNVTDVDNALVVEKWISAHNKRQLKTYFNGTMVSGDSLVRVA